MYELKVITSFSAAHQLKEFEGACENLHGHNWKIEVYVTSKTLGEAGIVMDFRVLKKHVNAVMADLDHKFLKSSRSQDCRYNCLQAAPFSIKPGH